MASWATTSTRLGYSLVLTSCPAHSHGTEYLLRTTLTKQVLLTRAGFSTYPSNGSGMLIKCSRSKSSISARVNCLCSGCGVSAHIERQRSANQALSSTNEPKRFVPASIQMRLRLSCTFFSTTPFSQPEATLQKSGSNR